MSGATVLLQQQRPRSSPPLVGGDAPAVAVTIGPGWPAIRQALARVYNRVGGCVDRLASDAGVDTPAILAVWYVESGGRTHTPGQAIIRFENHVLFDLWGKEQPDVYDAHFQHGGRPPATGDACRGPSGDFAAWKCHAYRPGTSGPFTACHQGQAQEYEVLALARTLTGESIALQCISMGGPQIMGFNYQKLGFQTPRAMFDAFQESEGAQVRGFFAFCRNYGGSDELMSGVKRNDWETFARLYNGAGNVASYAGAIRGAEAEARHFWPPSQGDSAEDLLRYARSLLGVPYEINLPGYPRVPGGRGLGKKYPDLDKGLDCSGFVLNVLQHNGYLSGLEPDYTNCDTLWGQCEPVDQASTAPGDLVFFRGTYDVAGLSHVGIVTEPGGTAMISARAPAVMEDSLNAGSWVRHLAGFARLRR